MQTLEQLWQQFWQHRLQTRVIDFEGSRLCVRGFEKETFVNTHPDHTESTDALSRAVSVLSDAAHTAGVFYATSESELCSLRGQTADDGFPGCARGSSPHIQLPRSSLTESSTFLVGNSGWHTQ